MVDRAVLRTAEGLLSLRSSELASGSGRTGVLIRVPIHHQTQKTPRCGAFLCLAEKEGFEPSMGLLTPYSLSRGAPSATRPLLRNFIVYACCWHFDGSIDPTILITIWSALTAPALQAGLALRSGSLQPLCGLRIELASLGSATRLPFSETLFYMPVAGILTDLLIRRLL